MSVIARQYRLVGLAQSFGLSQSNRRYGKRAHQLHEGHGMKVAIVVFDGVQSLDVAGPLDVFAEANANLSEHQKKSPLWEPGPAP